MSGDNLVKPLLTSTLMVWTKQPSTVVSLNTPFEVEVNLTSAVAMISVPVRFYVDGALVGTRWTSGYSATSNKAAWTITLTTEGVHQIQAVFNGDSVYQGASLAINVTAASTYTVTMSYAQGGGPDTAYTPPSGYRNISQAGTYTQPIVGGVGEGCAFKCVAPTGYKFSYWQVETDYTGDGVWDALEELHPPSTNPDTLNSATPNRRFRLTPIFTPLINYTFTMYDPSGQGAVSPSIGVHTEFLTDTDVPVSATPATGWIFDHWIYTTADGVEHPSTSNPSYLLMNGNRTIKAFFTQVPPTNYTMTYKSRNLLTGVDLTIPATIDGANANSPGQVTKLKDSVVTVTVQGVA